MDNRGFSNDDFEFAANLFGITSRQIVIELIESRVKNFDVLLGFVSFCRKAGFSHRT